MLGSTSSDVDFTKRIPPEILAEIFLFSTAYVSGEDKVCTLPWLLGHICSRWRAIALSTPTLWCSLVQIPCKALFSYSILSAFIERSSQLPLKLTLDGRWSNGERVPALNLLLSQSTRWEDVNISYVGERLGQSILTTLRSSTFACLKTLRLWLIHIPWEGEPLGIVFPNLTSLTLVSSSTDLLQHLSTPQLKHLRLEHSYSRTILGDVRSFLESSAYSLTQLGLVNTRIDNFELIDLLKLLPYLTELSIFSLSRPIDAFFIGLHSQKTVPCVAPELKRLSLDGAFTQSDGDLLLDMIESRCQDGDDEMACVPLLSVQLYTFKLFDVQTKLNGLESRILRPSGREGKRPGWK